MNRFLAVLLLMIPVILIAQPAPDTLWTRKIGSPSYDCPGVVRATPDGGCIIAGSAWSSGYLAKMNANGDIMWTWVGDSNQVGGLQDVQLLSSGGYVAVGGRIGTDSAGFIGLYTSEGDTLWTKTLIQPPLITFVRVLENPGGGYILIGQGAALNPPLNYYCSYRCLEQLETDGTFRLVSSHLGYASPGEGNVAWYTDLALSADGDMLISGGRGTWILTGAPPHLVYIYTYTKELSKLTFDLDTLWSYAPSTSYDHDAESVEGFRIASLPDGGCFALTEGSMKRFSSNGDVLWSQGPPGGNEDIAFTNRNSGYVLCSVPDITLAAFDSSGIMRWQRYWNPGGFWWAGLLVAVAADGGYFVVGTVSAHDESDPSDIFVLKTAPDPFMRSRESPDIGVAKSFLLSTYPNPFNPATTLSFTLPKAGRTKVTVYDLQGREVKVLADGMMRAGEQKMTFDGSELPSGIYFARVEAGEMTATQKMMLLK
jgi:hypothetical protein